METLREKVKKNIHNLFGGIREFGIGVGLRRYFYYEIFNRYGKCRDKYISAVYNYYESFLKDQIEEYKHKKQELTNEQVKRIWVCWWQGYDAMPELCKMCFHNLKRYVPKDCTLTLITCENYHKFVDIPQNILDKVNKGILPITQFSDILRNALLYKIGGLWIDSSIWITPGYFKTISWDNCFWSIKLDHVFKEYMIGQVVSGCRWSSFNMYGKKDNLANKFVYEAMVKFYTKHNQTLDYFGQNFFFRVAYNNVPEIKKLIDDIPFSNSHIYFLFLKMNLPFDEKEWKEMCSDQGAFKLSQKTTYLDEKDGKMTFAGYIRQLNAENLANEHTKN